MSLAIQECLGLMSVAYRGVQGQNTLIVEALLLENIYSVSRIAAAIYCIHISHHSTHPLPSHTPSLPHTHIHPQPIPRVRLAAVHYGSVVFPFNHIPSRFVCIIGAGDRYLVT